MKVGTTLEKGKEAFWRKSRLDRAMKEVKEEAMRRSDRHAF